MAPKTATTPVESEGFGDAIGKYLAMARSEPELSNTIDITRQIGDRVLGLPSAEDVLAAGEAGALSGEDIADRAFCIVGKPVWQESAPQFRSPDAPPVFVILNVRFVDDNSEAAVTCGGSNVLAQVYRLQELGAIPSESVSMRFRVVNTKRGFTTLWLAAA